MPKARTGSVRERRGKWWARIWYRDADGEWRQREQSAPTKALAYDLLRQMQSKSHAQIAAASLTFATLAERYRKHKIFQAEYVGDRKVAGMRDSRTATQRLQVLIDYFGDRLVQSITSSSLERFKRDRLATPVLLSTAKGEPQRSRPRTISTVNRELMLLRAVFYFAVREGWLAQNPFQRTESIISTADETKRHRILSREEEVKLLAACTGRRDYLRRLIICALDTGMRRGELLSLTWRDVDLKAHRIRVRATTTKTLVERTVPITARMEFELRGLPNESPDSLVFGVDDCKNGFRAACKDAEIDGLRFHDLRATAITRMLGAGIPAQFVMRISGHTQASTFQRYVRTGDQEIVDRVLEVLNAEAAGNSSNVGILVGANKNRTHG